MSETTRQRYPVSPERSISLGTILFGLILVAIGALWLLDVADVISVTWTFVAAVMLVLVGLALLVGAREGSHGGLIFLGIVLTVVLLISPLAGWPTFDGSVGERTINPTSFNEVEETYDWGVGSYTVDLRNVEFPSEETSIEIRQGMGEVNIFVPEHVGVNVEWQLGIGNVQVLDRQQSGIGLNGDFSSSDVTSADSVVILDIQLGIGSIEVQR